MLEGETKQESDICGGYPQQDGKYRYYGLPGNLLVKDSVLFFLITSKPRHKMWIIWNFGRRSSNIYTIARDIYQLHFLQICYHNVSLNLFWLW